MAWHTLTLHTMNIWLVAIRLTCQLKNFQITYVRLQLFIEKLVRCLVFIKKKKKILWTPAIVASRGILIELILDGVGLKRACLRVEESGKEEEEEEEERKQNIHNGIKGKTK